MILLHEFKVYESEALLEIIMVHSEQQENRNIPSKTPFKKGFLGFIRNILNETVEMSQKCTILKDLLEKSDNL